MCFIHKLWLDPHRSPPEIHTKYIEMHSDVHRPVDKMHQSDHVSILSSEK